MPSPCYAYGAEEKHGTGTEPSRTPAPLLWPQEQTSIYRNMFITSITEAQTLSMSQSQCKLPMWVGMIVASGWLGSRINSKMWGRTSCIICKTQYKVKTQSSLCENLLRISRWWQERIKPSVGSFWAWGPIRSVKSALKGGLVYITVYAADSGLWCWPDTIYRPLATANITGVPATCQAFPEVSWV